MNLKRWLLATAAAFAVFAGSDYVIHELWLGGFYRAHAAWWRPAAEMKALMRFLFLGEFFLAALLTLIYTKGYAPGQGALGQGFRFGLLMGLLLWLPTSMMTVFVYPYPISLVISWLAGGVAQVVLAGLVIGFLYRPAK